MRRTVLMTALALAGLLLAVGITMAATELTSQDVGLTSEPLTAGEELAPRTPPTTRTQPPAETTPARTTPAETTPAETTPAETTPAETTPAATAPAPPPAVEEEQDEDDSSGKGRGRGRGRGGDDD
jgi:cell division septation protein DedD